MEINYSVDWRIILFIFYNFLIDIYDESLKRSLTNFISLNNSEIIKQSVKIFILYFSLTLLIFIIFEIMGLRTFNSFNLALT